MNYLAHLLLSGNCPDRQVGGLLGDFVKGPLRGEWPRNIEMGIRLHRKIDTYTDHLLRDSGLFALFDPPWRRYAGIVTDIAFDHLLAQRWHDFSNLTLTQFCARFYRHLATHRSRLPAAAQHFNDRAPEVRWLESYERAEILPSMLNRVGARLKKPRALGASWSVVENNKDQFAEEFIVVFTALSKFSAAFISNETSALDDLPTTVHAGATSVKPAGFEASQLTAAYQRPSQVIGPAK